MILTEAVPILGMGGMMVPLKHILTISTENLSQKDLALGPVNTLIVLHLGVSLLIQHWIELAILFEDYYKSLTYLSLKYVFRQGYPDEYRANRGSYTDYYADYPNHYNYAGVNYIITAQVGC